MKKNKNTTIKKRRFFTLAMLPPAFIAGVLMWMFAEEQYTREELQIIGAQVGGVGPLIAATILQPVVYAVFCGFLGRLLAEKIGLWKGMKPNAQGVKPAVLLGTAFGIVMTVADPMIFSRFIEAIPSTIDTPPSLLTLLSSVAYGGIIEELMLRLFFMSLVVLIIWKLFFKKYDAKDIPLGVFVVANVIAAIMFRAGHLPATAQVLGITPAILIRCFLLNGAGGLIYGYIYQKYGIQHSMISHGATHIASKLLWLIIAAI